jgi:uncharacterized membrane protein YgcG
MPLSEVVVFRSLTPRKWCDTLFLPLFQLARMRLCPPPIFMSISGPQSLHSEDGRSMVLRNDGILPPHYTVSQWRWQRLESSSSWELQMSHIRLDLVTVVIFGGGLALYNRSSSSDSSSGTSSRGSTSSSSSGSSKFHGAPSFLRG